MNYKEHKLKCLPGYFAAVKAGKKRFEVRKNDRDFAPGDTVILQEWNPFDQKYSGDECRFKIGYVLDNYDAIITGYCVFSLLPVEEKEITRVEFIDGNGRAFVRYTKKPVELSFQDGDRTLKIFTDEFPKKAPIVAWERTNDITEDRQVVTESSLPVKCKVTEEEIEREAEKRFGEHKGGNYHAARPFEKSLFIKGAKWMLSRFSPLNTKEEKEAKRCATHCDWPNCTLSGCIADHVANEEKEVDFGIRTFRNVQMCAKVELFLKPEYMNTIFTWHQIRDAIMTDLSAKEKGKDNE